MNQNPTDILYVCSVIRKTFCLWKAIFQIKLKVTHDFNNFFNTSNTHAEYILKIYYRGIMQNVTKKEPLIDSASSLNTRASHLYGRYSLPTQTHR